MAVLRFLTFLGWTLVFVVLMLFAIKNTEPVTLHFYFDRAWHAPLVFVVLVSFAAGAVLGVIACVPPLARQRREILGLRKELQLREPDPSRTALVPPAATVPDVPSLP
jgi:putative membrane protein